MKTPADCSVVPIGRIPVDSAFNGHPRRRAHHGGAKLSSKGEERKKPSIKDIFGLTPLDIFGKPSTDDAPGPVKLLQNLVGTATSASSREQRANPPEIQESEAQNAANQPYGPQGSGLMPPEAHPKPQVPQIDTRTNLEKYLSMKMQEARGHMPMYPMVGSVPPVYQQNAYFGQMQMQPSAGPQFAYQPQFASPAPPVGGFPESWEGHGMAAGCVPPCHFENPASYPEQVTPAAYSRAPSLPHSRSASEQNCIPEALQFDSPPAWFQHKSYMPQVPQFSHMTAPVPGAPFHPGFSYATDFKYYYNYYPAEEYAGEIDGGDAAAQEEAVAREQQRAEELAGQQADKPQAIKPIITSKRRLESGKAVPL